MKFKVIFLTLFSTIILSSLNLSSQCEFRIELFDEYGDGWNGGSLDLFINGNLVLDDISIRGASSWDFYHFEMIDSAEITTVYTQGAYSYENSYEIIDNDDNVIYTDGSGGTTPEGIYPGSLYGVCYWYGRVTGIVHDYEGNPISGATIYNNYEEISTQTNELGIYMIYNITVDTIELHASKEQYYPVTKEVIIVSGDTVIQNFTLSIDTKIDNDYKTDDIKVFPNPTSEWLYITSETEIISSLLIDKTGKIIFYNTNNTKTINKNISSLNAGIYILRVSTKKGTTCKKVIIL